MIRKLAVEFLGTAILVFFAVGVATLMFGFRLAGASVAAGVVATALAFGLTLLALVFPLSFLLFGLGFLGILVQREHRALHDLIAGTAVIYSWDARAAHLRFLARQAELAPPP